MLLSKKPCRKNKYNNFLYLHSCDLCKKEFEGVITRVFCDRACSNMGRNRVKLPEEQREMNKKESRRKSAKKCKQKNSQKIKACYLAYSALESGKLTPKPCEICNKASIYSEMHHHDYNKPLEIIWLCHDCHTLVHVENRKEVYS